MRTHIVYGVWWHAYVPPSLRSLLRSALSYIHRLITSLRCCCCNNVSEHGARFSGGSIGTDTDGLVIVCAGCRWMQRSVRISSTRWRPHVLCMWHTPAAYIRVKDPSAKEKEEHLNLMPHPFHEVMKSPDPHRKPSETCAGCLDYGLWFVWLFS